MISFRYLLLALFALLAVPIEAQAQVLGVESWTEEWDEARGEWVRIADGAERFVALPRQELRPAAVGDYGPFRVLDARRAALTGLTGPETPAQFAALLRDYPQIEMLELHDCPGTENDRANMQLGRMIRAAGIATHVPHGGSVRSGAVELFLAGATRRIDDGAEFAVHSWMDIYGRGPRDFAPDAAANRQYLDYYREMGMTGEGAARFYAMTNSVGFDEAKWLDAAEMRGWLAQAAPGAPASEPMPAPKAAPRIEPRLAVLDFALALP